MNTLTVCGVELRPIARQAIVPGKWRERYEGHRGDLLLIVEAVVNDDGVACERHLWEGRAGVIYRWTCVAQPTQARHWLPIVAGTTPEGCAATLEETVRSVAKALGSVA